MDHLLVEFTGAEQTATVLYHLVVNRSYCSIEEAFPLNCSEHPRFDGACTHTRSLKLQTSDKSQI